MDLIKLPERYNYSEAYLTLRCNLGCSYCINQQSSVIRNRRELSAKEWANALNRIDFGDIPLTLGGGEPTLHKEFFVLLDLLRPDINIDLLTNLDFNIDEFISRTSPDRFNSRKNSAYRSIRVSYHAEKMNPEDLMYKVEKLQKKGFSIGVFGLNHPHNLESNMHMSEVARQNQVYFFIKDFLGIYDGHLFGYFKYPSGLDGKKKRVFCRTNEFLIDPCGDVYRCHRDLYKKEGAIINITNPHFKINERFKYCNNYGECNPCDVKLKANRFLKGGNCSVEIIG